MKFFFIILLVLSPLCRAQELRGTWIARNTLISKESIAQAMDSLANNNFNVVYINAWSRGYPLWQSDKFFQETGIKIDPDYSDRDILAEAIAEGHRLGLHVEAWFEYGFVGGWTGNQPPGAKGPIFQVHPDWVAKKINGTEIDGSNFYWMIHVHKDVQDFLIGLATEVARKYDLDGIELDRIRYSSLEYGYDNYTDSLYRTEHNGNPPPSDYQDANWLRWRGDKLNDFAKRIRDSVKAVNPNLNISNAPSLYSSNSYTSYESFAQDWVAWVNGDYVDNVQVQSYVTSASSFGNILDYIPSLITNKNKIFPCFAVKPGGTALTTSEVLQFINTSRNKGYNGNSIWYYTDLIPYFSALKSSVYNSKNYPPFSTLDWRELYKIVTISDNVNAVRTGNWINSTISGYSGASIYANPDSFASIEYFIEVPAIGIYEVYAYTVVGSNRTDSAEYFVYDSSGTSNVKYVDQSVSNNRRWFKLGDYYLKQGRQLLLKLTNAGTQTGKVVSADAVMIVLNRKLSPGLTTSIINDDDDSRPNRESFNLKNYPNPFNSQTTVSFTLNSMDPYKVSIYNIVGERIFASVKQPLNIGVNNLDINMNSAKFTSGIYLVNLVQTNKNESIKIVLSK